MCFSAEASFATAAILVPPGLFCVRNANQADRSFLPLSMLPIVFGVQQFCEGFVWIGFHRSDAALARAASLLFLFFALLFWLFWIPFCVFFIEPRRKVKCFLAAVTLVGLAGGLALYVPIIADPTVLTTSEVRHSIHYDLSRSPAFTIAPEWFWQGLYLAVVSVPFVISSSRGFLGFSILLSLSALVSHLAFRYAFPSVWCFFAALLSLYLCFFFVKLPLATRPQSG